MVEASTWGRLKFGQICLNLLNRVCPTPGKFLLSPYPRQPLHPQIGMLLKGEEMERVGVYPARRLDLWVSH